MPKSLFQEIVFTVMMVCVMVYAMICYNIALAVGNLSNAVFAMAFKEFVLMAPIAFVLDMAIAGPIAKKITFKTFTPAKDNPVWIVMSISFCSVWLMCPLMSFAATVLFKGGLFQKEVISIWIKTVAFNYPAALFIQFMLAGPAIRKLFGVLFSQKQEKNSLRTAA
ncbi:MAG: DUF2798 domain-containing protein [Treponema sp.]|nr:DUF2798 domain-containing protein [Treponema sp.]